MVKFYQLKYINVVIAEIISKTIKKLEIVVNKLT